MGKCHALVVESGGRVGSCRGGACWRGVGGGKLLGSMCHGGGDEQGNSLLGEPNVSEFPFPITF